MSTQVPRFMQGLLLHSLMLVSHRRPEKPAGQVQTKLPAAPSLQVPAFMQGCEEHSLMLVSQRAPEKPERHRQLKLKMPSTHEPPYWQGDDIQEGITGAQSV